MRHGIYTEQRATAILGVNRAPSALPFIVGTAPVHTVAGATPSVGELELLTSWADVEMKFGWVRDFGRYTLMEFLYAWFQLYGFAPVLAVNVFDPRTMAGGDTTLPVTLTAGTAEVAVTGAYVTEVNADSDGDTTFIEGVDYTLSYNASGYPVIVATSDEIADNATIYVVYKTIPADRCGVASAGVMDAVPLIDESFPKYGELPALIVAPGYSDDPEVKAAMMGRATYGGGWQARVIADIDSSAAPALTDAAEWKSENGYTDKGLDVMWPLAKLGDEVFHLSTIMACELARNDHDNGDIPFESASNRTIPITGLVNANGVAVYFNDGQANDSLNAQGITTALRWGTAGWVTWGNRGGAFPGSSDPAVYWRNFDRMLRWLNNTLRLSIFSMVDRAANYRNIESIVNSVNIMLNGIVGAGGLMTGARIEFRREDNPLTEMAAGRYVMPITLCPPTPMEAITIPMQVDVSQLNSLFAG